jgi:hypothetical protein
MFYKPKSDCDRARLAQQGGASPEPHVFEPLPSCPTMCGFPSCYATLAARKPWHTSWWDIYDKLPRQVIGKPLEAMAEALRG